MQRVELACHTGYSRMNGIGLGRDWVEFAIKNGIETLVITDCGNIDSYIDMQREINGWRHVDIKLIMGADLYVIDDRDLDGIVATSGRVNVLIQNEIGKKNLYKILSEAEMLEKMENGEPQIPLSLLLNNSEGLLIGSGTEDGLLIKSIEAKHNCENTIISGFGKCGFEKKNYSFFDYIGLPVESIPTYLTDSLLELAGYYRIPAVAINAPHYAKQDESTAYRILKGEIESERKHYLTTEEVLDQFEYLGKEEAYELVVLNSNKIADMCETVRPLAEGKLYPYINDQDEILRKICESELPNKYPTRTPQIRKRLEWELKAISRSQSAFMFIQIKDVMDRLNLKPFEVSSRGTAGSSIVAYLCGISEVDPIRANLSPDFFYGFKGDKEPDIDLNFRRDIQEAVHSAFADAPGVGEIIKAGIIGTISEEYADQLIDEYSEANNRYYWGLDRAEIIDSLTKCVRDRGQHPGGLLLIPDGANMTDICPITVLQSGNQVTRTSSYDYHCIDNRVYKFDALGHNSPEIIKRLYDLTGVDPRTISLEDSEVMEMFKWHGDRQPACAGIPEFSTEYVFEAMKLADCQSFDDLVKLCGLMHGTGVWTDNAEILLKEGTVSLSEILADRNDIYDKLLDYEIDEAQAFTLAEFVRKGKVFRGKIGNWDEWKSILSDHGVPEWFRWSCERIKYMFPRAHSYSYMICSWRMAWYKLHYPLEFYKVMLEVEYNTGFDAKYMANGKENLEFFAGFLKSDYASDSISAMEARKTCRLLNDFYEHGFEFIILPNADSIGEMFKIVDDKTIGVYC